MKVAVFHWNFSTLGGGERVALDLARAVGTNKVYTLRSPDVDKLGVKDVEIIDVYEYLPRWARILARIKNVRSVEYWLWEMVDIRDLGDYDVAISSGSALRSLILPEEVMHVHYCHSVPRWLFDLWHFRWKENNRSIRKFVGAEIIRIMDAVVDKRVDYYFVNSELIKRRLWKYAKRDAVVLHPAIHIKNYRFKEYGDFFLHIGRFDTEKNIRPVIDAALRTGYKLVLIGKKGTDPKTYEYAKKLSERNGNVEFLDYVTDEVKYRLLAECKAVIYNPINEDFGIVPVEALASGKPVVVNHMGYPPILIRKTGFVEKDGILKIYNGGIVTRADSITIANAMKLVDKYEWNPDNLRKFADKFDFRFFKTKLNTQLRIWKKEFEEMLYDEYEASAI